MGVVQSAPSHRWLKTAETLALATGLGCLLYVGAMYIDGAQGSRQALQRFAELQTVVHERADATDLTLWSPQRIAAWQSTLALPRQVPLAVLRIPKIDLEVPVLEGTGDVSLTRGVGHIEETAIPGMDGNAGIAGHRDGFFRGLKDVGPGDELELETLQGKQVYRVERTWIVNPEDVSVLDPTPGRSVTLVTCYPFYFVGSAPQRYIVRAVHAESRVTPSFGFAPY